MVQGDHRHRRRDLKLNIKTQADQHRSRHVTIYLTATTSSQASECEAGRPQLAVGKAIGAIDDFDKPRCQFGYDRGASWRDIASSSAQRYGCDDAQFARATRQSF